MSKKVLIVNDLHVGDKIGLLPPEVYVDSHDRARSIHQKANEAQIWMYQKWEQMIADVGPVYAVIACGDLCEGVQPKSKGMGLWTPDQDIQSEVAASLLEMIKAEKYFIAQGTPFHTGENISSDLLVAKKIGAVYGDELSIKVDNVRIHASHKIGVSGANTAARVSAIAKEIMHATINAAQYGKYDIIVRGHAHYAVAVKFSNTWGIVNPGWKGRDSFAARSSLVWNPDLGYTILEIDGDLVQWNTVIHKFEKDHLMQEYVI